MTRVTSAAVSVTARIRGRALPAAPTHYGAPRGLGQRAESNGR